MEIPVDEWDEGGPLLLWWTELDVSASSLHRAIDVLSYEERARADRYLSPIDRDRFVAARAELRSVLGTQLGCAPGAVEIGTDDDGKPRLEGPALRFNASRSGGMALFATSWEMEVGVDVEQVREDADIEGIAARFFSRSEREALDSLGPEQRLAASFQCWTRKEAYLKGIGTGLRVPLPGIEVWAAGGAPATIGAWSVHQVEVAPGFAAAVAGAGQGGWAPAAPQGL